MDRPIPFEDLPSRTLAKGLLILDVFSQQRPDWGIRELARELDLNPATVVRLVTTLEQLGYLERDAKTQRYSLGPMVIQLARLYRQQNPLPELAQKVFESYADRFDYNFYLGRLNNFQVIYLAVLDGRGPIQIVVEPGAPTALHTTALGKALLAFQPDDYIHQFIQQCRLPAYTERSIQDAGALWEQIQAIRRTGVATNDGEHYEDIAAVGVPIRTAGETAVMGISLAYPRHLVYENRIDVGEVISITQEIAQKVARWYD
jgi:DNA-binding IclR family transcriptional regulator